MKKIILITVLLLSQHTFASIISRTVEYKSGDTTLEGVVVEDTKFKGSKPVVIIVHDWMGNGSYSKTRAEQMAKLGYVAFAADIYGKGVRPKNVEEAKAQATKFKSDRALMRERAKAAFDYVSGLKSVDNKKIFAMGYCFGGTTVLEMARSGLNLKAVASFHGGLDFPNQEDYKNIKSKIMVLHGAIDPYIKAEDLESFQKGMNEANVDYQFISYSGAVHAFTQKHVGSDVKTGAAYNEVADKRSFQAMKMFFEENLK